MIDLQKHGPWAVIAGGSEGLAESFANQLAAQGFKLILIARNKTSLEKLAGELTQSYGAEVRILVQDLTAPDILEILDTATKGLEVGLLIYNAGAESGAQMFVDKPLESALNCIALNTIGQTKLAHFFGGPMKSRGRGGIMLLGSMGGIAGCPTLAVYGAVKAYTQLFAEALWAEMGPVGVDVSALVIGPTRTETFKRAEAESGVISTAADPDEVAQWALTAFGNGPVLVPEAHQQGFDAMRAMPRAKAVKIMARSLEQNPG